MNKSYTGIRNSYRDVNCRKSNEEERTLLIEKLALLHLIFYNQYLDNYCDYRKTV